MKIKKTNLLLLLMLIGFVLSPYTITKLTTQGEEQLACEVLGEQYEELEAEMAAMEEEEQTLLQNISNAEEEERNSNSAAVGDGNVSSGEADQDSVEPEMAGEDIVQEEDDSEETALQQEEENNSQEETDQQLQEDSDEEEQDSEKTAGESFDPATAPSNVSLKVRLKENKKAPDFDVEVNFVGVGREPLEEEIDKDGEVEITLGTGRYYLEFDIEDEDYELEDSAPAFFLLPNKELDLGKIYLVEKE